MIFTVPDAYLDEYCDHIWELFRLKVSKDQLSQFLKEEEISRKKVWHYPSPTYICSCRKKHANAIQFYADDGYKKWGNGEPIKWSS